MANSAVASLFVTLEGRFAKFESQMSKTASKLDKFGAKFEKIGKRLTTSLTLPLAGIATAAIAATTKLDEAFDKIRISTGATGDKLKTLQADFRAVFKNVPNDANEVATAIGELNQRLGLTGAPLQDLATQLLNLSRITGSELNTTIEASTQVFNKWTVAQEKQSATLDLLFRVTQQTGISFGELSSQLVQFGVPLRQLGFDLDSSAALLGKLQKEGVNTEQVMAAFKVGLTNLAKAGATDLPAAFQASIEKIKEFKTFGEAAAEAAKIFGAKAGPELAAAIRSGKLEIDGLLSTLQTSGDTINGAAQQTDGLSEAWKKIRNAFMLAAEPLEGALTSALEGLTPILLALADVVVTFSQLFAELPQPLQAAAVGIFAIAAAAGPTMIAIGGLTSGFAKLSKALLALKAATVLVVAEWALLFAAIYAIYKMVKSPEFARGLQVIKNKLDEWWASFKRGVQVIQEFTKSLQNDFNRGLLKIVDTVVEVKDKIIKAANEIYEGMRDALVGKFNQLTADFERGLDVIYDSVVNLKRRLFDQSPFPDIEEGAVSTFERIATGMISNSQMGADGVFNTFENLSTDLEDVFTDLGNSIGDIVGSIAELFGVSGGVAGDLASGIAAAFQLYGQFQANQGYYQPGGAPGSTGGGFGFGMPGTGMEWDLSNASLASYANIIGQFGEIVDEFGQGVDGIVKGGATAVGGGIGGFFGGPAGAAVGMQIGNAIGEIIGPLFEDDEHPDQKARRAVVEWLEQNLANKGFRPIGPGGAPGGVLTNIVQGDGSQFTGDWAEQFHAMGAQAEQVFTGLGTALTNLLGVTDEVGAHIGFILATNLNGNIDNARMLVQALGLDYQSLEDALTQAAVAGQISWHEYEVQLQGLAQAFQPGLAAVADMTGAVDNLIASGGRGQQAIKSLRDLAIEATEAGVKDLEGLKNYLLNSGKFTSQQIEQIFAALRGRGVTSLEDLANTSDRVAGGIIADLESMGFAFTEAEDSVVNMVTSLEDANEVTNELDNRLRGLPHEIRTRVVIEEHTEKTSSGDSGGSGSSPGGAKGAVGFARGGVIHGTQLANIGNHVVKMSEFRPEAFFPLDYVDGKLGLHAKVEPMGTSPISVVYNVNAPNASAVTVDQIERMLHRVHESAVNTSILKIADAARRGGGIASSIRG